MRLARLTVTTASFACTPSAPPMAVADAPAMVEVEPPSPVHERSPVPLPSTPSARPPSLVPVRDAGVSSSALALGRLEGDLVALIADADERALTMVGLADGEAIATLPLEGTPGHVLIDDEGRVHVTVRDAGLVVTAALACSDDADPHEERCAPTFASQSAFSTPPEPIALALALADDGATLLVSCGIGRALVGWPLREGGRDSLVPLAREPRGIAQDEEGSRLFIAHAVGSTITIVDTSSERVIAERRLHWRDEIDLGFGDSINVPRFAQQGHGVVVAGQHAHVPMVLAYPGDERDDSSGYGASIDGFEPFFPHEPTLVSVDRDGVEATLRLRFETRSAESARSESNRRPYAAERPPCLLPRGVGVDRNRDEILVACADIGQLIAYRLDGDDLDGAETQRWLVGAGAEALGTDPARDEAWIWAPFARRLTGVSLASPQEPPRAFTLAATEPVLAESGRQLFHAPLAFDGRSCASCHVDGRDDGLVWNSPIGMVATPVLAGRIADTAPFGWHGERDALIDHMKRTFRRLRADKPDEASLAALAEYLESMPEPPQAAADLDARQLRGRALFFDPEVGCGDCHTEGAGVDGLSHRIGPGRALDTPSLRFVGDTAPYMHDGRYSTLREVLVATNDIMGSTAQLPEDDVVALIAYLRTL